MKLTSKITCPSYLGIYTCRTPWNARTNLEFSDSVEFGAISGSKEGAGLSLWLFPPSSLPTSLFLPPALPSAPGGLCVGMWTSQPASPGFT